MHQKLYSTTLLLKNYFALKLVDNFSCFNSSLLYKLFVSQILICYINILFLSRFNSFDFIIIAISSTEERKAMIHIIIPAISRPKQI